jgi:hypothetical protein
MASRDTKQHRFKKNHIYVARGDPLWLSGKVVEMRK